MYFDSFIIQQLLNCVNRKNWNSKFVYNSWQFAQKNAKKGNKTDGKMDIITTMTEKRLKNG